MNMDELIKSVIDELNTISNSKLVLDLIYAFNGVGKTRISRSINETFGDKCLCFNSLFENCFFWDNDNYHFNIINNSWIINVITDQGMQKDVITTFQDINGDNIEPIFSEDNSYITFNAKTQDGFDESIKISKAEETLFIWSMFFTLLEFAISELFEEQENRSTDIFDNLKYIIIDDPVSSIDDSAIVKQSIKISNLIDSCNGEEGKLDLSFLILTHHTLFYNSMYNLNYRNNKIKLNSYLLNRINYNYILESKRDTVFSYHIYLIKNIKNAIQNDGLDKTYFNMFRIILEKTSNFFGYKKFDDCLEGFEKKQNIALLINSYSHGNAVEFENVNLTDDEKEVFSEAFNYFISKYNISIEE